jgi:cytochrome b subunit of formate dehydrogenase/nitrate/TMAO reductase-like tetraheme cytochrome c subunit
MMPRNLFRRSLPHLVLLSVCASAVGRAQTNKDCLMCHEDRTASMKKEGRTISLYVDAVKFRESAHAGLSCVDCHRGFNPSDLPHAKRIMPVNCTTCHSDEQFVQYGQSVHGRPGVGKRPNVACADCHSAHRVVKISAMALQDRRTFVVETCGRCHAKVNELYMTSNHGLALTAGVQSAPTCVDCHGEHNVAAATSEGAPTGKKNQAAMCMKCHADSPEVRSLVGPAVKFIKSYETSVHAKAVQAGNDMAATCSDCHGSHGIRKASDPLSRVNRKNISTTCGQCHPAIQREYNSSIHGVALASGISASATCTDCHGEHNILSPKDASSPVAPTNVSARVCSPCHSSVRLTNKYGLASDRFTTFEDSYHGLASRAGSVVVANCASCHGVHDIKPSSDPTSRISKANLAKTCGSCHPGANENFTKGSVHVIASTSDEGVLRFVANTYIVLISMTIGVMLFHNFTDYLARAKRKLAVRRGEIIHAHPGHRLYLRMTLQERIQHASLLISFFLLVITGFALRYPDAWWVAGVRNLSPWMFEIRGIVHRVAAVVLVGTSLYHLYYIFFVARGKELLRDLLPVRQDIHEAFGVLKYNLGLAKEKPLLGRFCYAEKIEYWALIWGTAVMTLTGIILWFDNTFLGLLTKLGWDIARTVHFYEAWLALLSILIWHFYFVIFNPDTYPINMAFWRGTLTEEEMLDEHPRELQEIKRREEAEQASETGEG